MEIFKNKMKINHKNT